MELNLEKEKEEFFKSKFVMKEEEGGDIQYTLRSYARADECWQYIEELVKKKVAEATRNFMKELLQDEDKFFRDRYLGKQDN